MKKKAFFGILLLSFLVSGVFAGTIYYVDGARGNDAYNGQSLGTAWKTIRKANLTLQAGDTVYIRAGTYIENNNDAVIYPQNSGSPGAYIRYENYGGETVYLRGAYHPVCIWYGKDYIYVKGMNCDQGSQAESQAKVIGRMAGKYGVFENCVFKYSKLYASGARGVYIQGSYNKLLGCEVGYIGIFEDTGDGDCVWLDQESHHNLVEGCTIYHGEHNCLTDNGKYNVIRRNNLYNDYWRAASHGGDDGLESHSVVEENMIHDTHGIGSGGGPAPGFQIDNPGMIFRRNKIYNTYGNGVFLASWGPDATIHNPSHSRVYHNVFYKAGLSGNRYDGYGVVMRAMDVSSTEYIRDCIFKNNIVYQCISDGVGWNDWVNPDHQTVVSNHWGSDGNPGLVNPEAGDFSLQAGSPCLDAGSWLTWTIQSGSGTHMAVEDARYFTDGCGVTAGDLIQLQGRNETARIVGVDYQNGILTLDKALSWNAAQGVALAYSGSASDIGAHEYSATNPVHVAVSAFPTSGQFPLPVNLTGTASGGTPPYSYRWDFGDGSSSSEPNPSHTYAKAGDFTAILAVTDSQNNRATASERIYVSDPSLSVSFACFPQSLFFAATTAGPKTSDQTFRILKSGLGTLAWTVEDNSSWLVCSPVSGINDGKVTVLIRPEGIGAGIYTGSITVSCPGAVPPTQTIKVTLKVTAGDQAPIGYCDAPPDGATVTGSLSISGWALDDIEVTRVEVKRSATTSDPPGSAGSDGLIYIGDAIFIEGARPDIEKLFADVPFNYRGGWGYMMLTNVLPNRGNGSFSFVVFAHDASGHRVEIGRKNILCDNANQVNPFGTIDSPKQGESISGSSYINFGWALTPLPKTIPRDGRTISVWVDGVELGHPVYNQYRQDIATSFPEYNNASGAVGYYYLDTTKYRNGVHTIGWSVADDQGRAEGIGSRFFSIDNAGSGLSLQETAGAKRLYQEDQTGKLKIRLKEIRKGFRLRVENNVENSEEGIPEFRLEQMEPGRIVFEGTAGDRKLFFGGWAENEGKDLPAGSTFDQKKGAFSWAPPPGFVGKYLLHFIVTDGVYMSEPLKILINVIPKG